VTTWADERSLRRCLMQLSDTCFGTTALSSPRRAMAVAPGGGRSLYRLLSPLTAGLWGRRFQYCLYLVGPPEDSLRLWLRQSLVPGRTPPCSEEDIIFAAGFGRRRRWGVVVVLIVHLEWGPSSTPNTRSSCAEPNRTTST
jgi:hypothetical protein